MGNALFKETDLAAFPDEIRGHTNALLVLEEVATQAVLKALSFLLSHGCTEATARQMLRDQRECAAAIRAEWGSRGKEPVFDRDQTRIN